MHPPLQEYATVISDSGASDFYLTPWAPCANVNPSAPQVVVGTAGDPPHVSAESCDVLLPCLPARSGHIMPNLHQNLMGIGKLCDHDCKVLFGKTAVTVF